jgi:hypothetical protein
MIAALTKPVNEVKLEDLKELVARGWTENENVEFKSRLAARQGIEDPWYTGGRVVDFAKEKLFKEIVGFANSSGGRLFLGIRESAVRPAKATQITHLPKCHDLAEILERFARDLIEPSLPSLRVTGIITEADQTGGVVILEAGASVKAPHRSKLDLQCYVRRGAETRPMTMTEIQDLTLYLSRHLDEVKRVFEDWRQAFEKWLNTGKPVTHRSTGLRVTAIPVGSRLQIPRVYRNPDVVAGLRQLRGRSSGIWTLDFVLNPFDPGQDERSILRGTRRSSGDKLEATYHSIWSSGVIEIGHKEYWNTQNQNRIYLSKILGSLANVILDVERFREAAAAPDVEYGIEVQLVSGGTGDHSDLGIAGLTAENLGFIRSSDMPFLPDRISLGDKQEAINWLLADILDTCEYPYSPRPRLTIEWG